MIKNLLKLLKENIQILIIVFLVIIITVLSFYFNYNAKTTNQNFNNFINNIYLKKTLTHIFDNFEPKYKNINHKVKFGETFDGILKSYLINKEAIKEIKDNLKKKINLNKLNTKQSLIITLNQENNKITKFVFQASSTEKINLERNIKTDKFNQEILTIKLEKKIVYKENIILQSLYKAASDESIPANTIIEFARIYGFQVDFQRDIRKHDKFQIMYEVYLNKDKNIIETGEILFANLILSGQENTLYYFEEQNNEGHYDKNGKSIQKALMKTPINGARLSSSFGMRKHPIDGFNKMHKGTDFAAPKGTPIMASGNGVIKKAGWCGGGGNCVKIKHNSTYETIYAHMSKFARGIKSGVRVKQGQTIGYVGSTGKSTGPHLHYEVVVNGKKVNSQKLKLPSGKTLKGKARKIFETKKIKLDVLKSEKILGLN